MTQPDQHKNHLQFIDSFRAIAAIYVVMHHGMVQYFDPTNNSMQALTGMKKKLVDLFMHGHSAVNLFIVLSGFSLMLSITKNDYQLKGGALQFIKKRVIRIVPPYYFAILFSLILIWLFIGNKTGSHWDGCIPVSSWDIINHLLLIHDFFFSSVAHINHALWSIGVEFRIYLFFPFLVWVWRKYGILSTLLAAITITIAGALLLVFIHNHYYSGLLVSSSGVSPYIILFVFGMIAADIAYSNKPSIVSIRSSIINMPAVKKAMCVFGYIVFFLIIKHFFKTRPDFENSIDVGYDVGDILFGSFAALLIFTCATISSKHWVFRIVKVLYWPPLVFAGGFSYSLYLIHAPLLQFLTQYVLMPAGLKGLTAACILVGIGTPIIIAFAYLFFIVCERPFLNFNKKTKS